VKSEETIVVAATATEAMTESIEGDTRDDGDVDSFRGRRKEEGGRRILRAGGFKDAEGAWGEVVRTGVTAELHRGGIEDFGQKDGLTLSDKVIDELMGVDFVGQRVIGQDNPGIG
jgi:hypothetical protein